MRYLCLIYDNEQAWEKMPKEESDAVFGEYFAFTEGIKQSGKHLGGEALQPSQTATTVRVRNGKWKDKQLISEKWLQLSRTPTPVQPTYGFMNYFLNTGKRSMPNAPEQAFTHQGNGANLIYVDPVNDLVIVARWIRSARALDGVVQQLLAGMN